MRPQRRLRMPGATACAIAQARRPLTDRVVELIAATTTKAGPRQLAFIGEQLAIARGKQTSVARMIERLESRP